MTNRSKALLSAKIERNLATYATAASAAVVGVAAWAQPAEAKIVYTPANLKIGLGLGIDLDHDGTVDFNLVILSRGKLIFAGFRVGSL